MKEWWDKLFGAIHERSRESDRDAPTLSVIRIGTKGERANARGLVRRRGVMLHLRPACPGGLQCAIRTR
jgi:hypothetical protein